MKRAARWSAVAALLLLTIGGFVVRSGDRSATPTSFGTGRNGYHAVFTLLAELGMPVARSYVAPEELPARATVWWIEPRDLCAGDRALGDEQAAGDWEPLRWIVSGGTAVVFLPPARSTASCEVADGVVLPGRRSVQMKEGVAAQVVSGPLTVEPRALDNVALWVFDDASSWSVLATLGDHPFIIERTLGSGRFFAVADVSFLRNAWLDRGDAAPLAVDLVRAAGAPLFDEHGHGFGIEGSALGYLARSSALPVFLGLFLMGALLSWRGHAMPPRMLPPADDAAPVLDTFVDSLAGLYAGTRDHARVASRYRELTAARLRRHFGLPPDTAVESLVERLRRGRHLSPDLLRSLTDAPPVASEASLYETARALDALVREATR